jgi:hypothetical protein
MSTNKPMRETMPEIAGWIDDLRAAFGAPMIEGIIRESVRDGAPGFYACENGHEVGVQPELSESVWRCEGLEDRYAGRLPPDVAILHDASNH